MTFRERLTQHGLTAETVSHTIRKKITTYEELEATIQDQKRLLLAEKGKKKRAEMESDIAEAEENLELLNNTLVKDVDRYNKNKDTYRSNGTKLNQNRAPKKAEGGPAATPPATPPATPAPGEEGSENTANNEDNNEDNNGEGGAGAASGEGNNDDSNHDNNDGATPPVDPPEKKKTSGTGWLIGGIVLFIGAAIGINAYNNR
jgi:hypothetical protein